jgi:hypothetical protein
MSPNTTIIIKSHIVPTYFTEASLEALADHLKRVVDGYGHSTSVSLHATQVPVPTQTKTVQVKRGYNV